MKYTITKKIFIAAMMLSPFVALAANDFETIIKTVSGWAIGLINLLLIIATLVFLWGVVKYISAGGDAAKIKEARSYILWGIVGLAIMGSVWVLVRFLQKNVINEEGTGEFPSYKTPPVLQ